MHGPADIAGPPARVCVAGASGYIGGHVVAELVARGHDVVALVRRTSAETASHDARLAGARQYVVDVTNNAAVAKLFAREAPRVVISCLAARGGTPAGAWAIDERANRLLLDQAEANAASHFVLLSALCVQTPCLAFQHAKLAFEARLSRSRLAWSIVRPSALFKSLAGQIERVRRGQAFLLFGPGEGPACLPISEADLACFIADCLIDPQRWQRILPIGGPGEAVTPAARARQLFALADQTPVIRRIPLALPRGAARVFAALAWCWPRAGDLAEFARIAAFYATEPMLVIDPATGRHSAAATPQTGHDTLAAFYERAWHQPDTDHGLAEQALFERRRRKRP